LRKEKDKAIRVDINQENLIGSMPYFSEKPDFWDLISPLPHLYVFLSHPVSQIFSFLLLHKTLLPKELLHIKK